MRKTKGFFLFVTGLLLLTLLLGSAMGEAAITVTDMKGREIRLDAPATRVVALTPSDCEILYAIGAGETLVGRGEYCDYPAGVLDVPSVQSGAETNVEQIVALEPQVVIMSTMAQSVVQTQALEAAGIRVVVNEAVDIAGVYEAIEVIGAVVGHDDEAQMLVANMQASFADITAKVTGDGSQKVYFEVSPLQWGLWTAGSGTFMDELATMLGLTNTFADVQNWGEISQEQVLARDPDYIVTIAMYFGEGPTPVEEIQSREGWQALQAVQNGMILNLDSNEISRPGPRLVDAARTLYQFVYAPETLAPAA
ncbi:MAG: ABC transporter substrate-binding protein [Candidatus Limiplasma sp.]|nr:ABC transporter substrate-binding protein [Candidatus Limiplasma sp.]MEA5145876.1 ABC transporter substrate-binding protein [Candidatus Limiplasma sp.]